MSDLAGWVHEHAVVLDTESVAPQDVSTMSGFDEQLEGRVTPLRI